MNDGASSQGGFTIVETMIVLAVSGVMFLSAVLLVAGQQRKVEFTQAIQDARSAISQSINEVSAGYYPRTGNMKCQVVGGDLLINPAASTAFGSNTGCIFLGKVMQFAVAGTNPQQYQVHVVAGLQDNDGTLVGAKPKPVDVANITQTFYLRNGLHVKSMRYLIGATRTNIGAVAFLSGLGSYTGNGLETGTQQMMLVPVRNSGTVSAGTSTATVYTAIDNSLQTSPINPDGGVQICLEGGAKQWAMITIGSNNRNLSVKLDIKNTDCSL